ncbi:hypothetical protein CUJ86_09015 [Methanofollis fontis]|uniref:Uncharacterized protein n=1 Tax=Methanofollis fontis TaxID=2052832 RepID=A0A483CPY9_9EURY|nr:hypothetical protein CUJ86_09015 [Methanofollis fontis]
MISDGEDITAAIILKDAENGLSGYNMSLSVIDSQIAHIRGFSYPEWAALHDNGTLPAGETWIEAIDIGDTAEGNEGPISLGSVILQANTAGTTTLRIHSLNIQDNRGNSYEIDGYEVEIHVEASSGGGGNDEQVSTEPPATSTPGPTMNITDTPSPSMTTSPPPTPQIETEAAPTIQNAESGFISPFICLLTLFAGLYIIKRSEKRWK